MSFIEWLKAYLKRVRIFYDLEKKDKIILRQNPNGTNEIELNNVQELSELKQEIKRLK